MLLYNICIVVISTTNLIKKGKIYRSIRELNAYLQMCASVIDFDNVRTTNHIYFETFVVQKMSFFSMQVSLLSHIGLLGYIYTDKLACNNCKL